MAESKKRKIRLYDTGEVDWYRKCYNCHRIDIYDPKNMCAVDGCKNYVCYCTERTYRIEKDIVYKICHMHDIYILFVCRTCEIHTHKHRKKWFEFHREHDKCPERHIGCLPMHTAHKKIILRYFGTKN